MAKYFYKYFYLNKFLFLFFPRVRKKNPLKMNVFENTQYIFLNHSLLPNSVVSKQLFFFLKKSKWDFYKPLQVKRLTLQNSVTRPAEPLL